MRMPLRHLPKRDTWRGVAAWLVVALAGGVAMVRWDIAQRREAFDAQARVAHRVLSQRAAQHDAILATLQLLATPMRAGDTERPERHLAALYPQVLAVLRRGADQPWPAPAWAEAEDRSRATGVAELAAVDGVAGQFTLVRAGVPTSVALRLRWSGLVPWDEWPFDRQGPARALLVHADHSQVLQAGTLERQPWGALTAGFVFSRPLASTSQPFELRVQRATGPGEWPWRGLLTWAVATAVAAWLLHAAWQAGKARRRAESMVRVGRVGRLNALGELAAGMAHELNQPLSAILANTQAAQRLLADDPPELDTARLAMGQASAQARRAADVVTRLRQLVQAPARAAQGQPVELQRLVRQVVDLLEPEARALGVQIHVVGQAPPAWADPVALEQIVHNLLINALQALAEVPRARRRLTLLLGLRAGRAELTVRDTGPGISPADLPHVFEPFFTTRRAQAGSGLGLGLSLCETLAQTMGGSLKAGAGAEGGAAFVLSLPVVQGAP